MSENATPSATSGEVPGGTVSENVTPSTTSRAVPRGIMWLSLFILLVAVAKFIFGFLAVGIGTAFGISSTVFLGDAFWGHTGAGIVQIIGAAIWAAVGFGLRGLKHWAWIVSVIAAVISALSGIVSFLTGGELGPFLGIVELAIAVLIFVYLFRPSVRGAFAR